jgi:invasin D
MSELGNVLPINSQPAWKAGELAGSAPSPVREAASAGPMSTQTLTTPDDLKRELKLDGMIAEFAAAKAGRGIGGGAFDDARLAIKAHVARRDTLLDKLGVAQPSPGAALPNEGLFGVSSESIPASQGNDAMSDADIFKLLEDLISGDKGNMDKYAEIVQGLTGFFSDITDLMSKLSSWVEATSDDPPKMYVNAKQIKNAIDRILSKYATSPIAQVPTADIAKWQAELGDAVKIDANGNVTINLDKLTAMKNTLPNGDDWTIDTAKYQAWSTGFSAEKDGIQNDVQTMVEKCSRDWRDYASRWRSG